MVYIFFVCYTPSVLTFDLSCSHKGKYHAVIFILDRITKVCDLERQSNILQDHVFLTGAYKAKTIE
jgi:hypothetical protein